MFISLFPFNFIASSASKNAGDGETRVALVVGLSRRCKLALSAARHLHAILTQRIGLERLEKFPNIFVNLTHLCQFVCPKRVVT